MTHKKVQFGEGFNNSAELKDRRAEIINGYKPLVREFLRDFSWLNFIF